MRRPLFYAIFDTIGFRWWFPRIYRLDLRGVERVPEGPAILVANHESLIDPWFLGLVTRRPVRYMAKAELWSHAATRWAMEGFGAFPVSRGRGDRGAVDHGARLLAEGAVLGIFPQGTCLPYRRRPWLRGAARLAISTGTPIVPVCIVGTERVLRPGKLRVGFPRVTVLVCEPIEVARGRPTVAAAKQLTACAEHVIEQARAPYGPPAHAWFPEERTI
jgi:1-acyl-sn-glycerol-3-phosphate acyltransferase